jgi:patatin-like phospholipase/acyl hydrolase
MGNQRAPFRVLSLDGGGIRGLYTVVLLHGIAQRVARMNGQPEDRLDIGNAFHLIVGTSTGALLATALAAGVSLEDVISLYWSKASSIFHNPVPQSGWPLYRWLWRHRAEAGNSPEALRSALESVFKDETVEQMYQRRGIALCVPTVNVETQKSWVYKTPHDKKEDRLQRDNKYRLVDVCIETGTREQELGCVAKAFGKIPVWLRLAEQLACIELHRPK